MKRVKQIFSLVLAAALSVSLVCTPFTAMAAEAEAAAAEYEEMLTDLIDETEDSSAEASTEPDAEGETSEEPAQEPVQPEGSASSSVPGEDASGVGESSIPQEKDPADGNTPAGEKDPADSSAGASSSVEPIIPPDESTSVEPDPEPTPEEIYKSSKKIKLRYDDRYTFKGNVKSIVSLTITSKRTGSSKADSAVLKLDGKSKKKAIACGCGTALVTLENGTTYGVQVSKAPISLLLIIGQSNAEGRVSRYNNLKTYKKQWIVNEEGQVYNTYAPSTQEMYKEVGWYSKTGNRGLTINNEGAFIPTSLTKNDYSNDYKRTNNLTSASSANGKSGVDSALAYEWTKLTGEKVWIVNAAHHGSPISSWQPGSKKTDNNFWQAVELYQAAEKLLSKEIAAGHYSLSRKGIFWLQGEQDKKMSASKYLSYFKTMNSELRKQLNGSGISHMKRSIAFTGIMMVRAATTTPDTSKDLEMTGPRLAQYYMSNSSKYSTIYLASQAEESWTSDKNVQTYFKNKYGSQAKYSAANPNKSGKITMPSKVSHLHSTIHYTQMAYNEIGMDAADNICYALGYAKAPRKTVKSVKIVTADGYTNRNKATVKLSKGSTTKFAVKVYPTYLSKGVEVKTTKATQYSVSGIKLVSKGTSKVQVTAGDKSTYLTIKSK